MGKTIRFSFTIAFHYHNATFEERLNIHANFSIQNIAFHKHNATFEQRRKIHLKKKKFEI
jgi:hypothetical protein